MAKKKKVDKTRDNFEIVMEKLGILNRPKSLFDNGKIKTEFEANGTKYAILPMDKVFNFGRQLAYQNFELAFALNQTPQEIADRFVKQYENQIRLMQATGSDWVKMQDENLRDCLNSVDSMKGEHSRRLPSAYFICSLFICKEGEDLSQWSWDDALEKVDDWTKENLNPWDFFTLALRSSKNSMEILNEDLGVI
jgi:hypothetical protein